MLSLKKNSTHIYFFQGHNNVATLINNLTAVSVNINTTSAVQGDIISDYLEINHALLL